jgi:hypothetical protein
MLANYFCIASMKSPLDQEANKKRPHVLLSIIFGFISTSSKFRNHDPMQVGFLEDLMLLVVKRLLHMKNVEFIWLQKLTYKLCP